MASAMAPAADARISLQPVIDCSRPLLYCLMAGPHEVDTFRPHSATRLIGRRLRRGLLGGNVGDDVDSESSHCSGRSELIPNSDVPK
jgi:hypothetical protein